MQATFAIHLVRARGGSWDSEHSVVYHAVPAFVDPFRSKGTGTLCDAVDPPAEDSVTSVADYPYQRGRFDSDLRFVLSALALVLSVEERRCTYV